MYRKLSVNEFETVKSLIYCYITATGKLLMIPQISNFSFDPR